MSNEQECRDTCLAVKNSIDDVLAVAAGIGELARLLAQDPETGGIAALLGAQAGKLRDAGEALDAVEYNILWGLEAFFGERKAR